VSKHSSVTAPIAAEVWGSPIDHSRSPDLHLACYRHLGIHGTYKKRLVTTETLSDSFLRARDTLTGVSLTMPLKTGILELVADHRGLVDTLGAANTAVSQDTGWWLENTDPVGAAAMMTRLLPDTADSVFILGAGATAKSVVAGLSHMGFPGQVLIIARSVERSQATITLAQSLGLAVDFVDVASPGPLTAPGLVISTLPSGTPVDGEVISAAGSGGAPLIDVGYHPWPTPLAASWQAAGRIVHSGLPMLMFQALGQIRCFAHGDLGAPLPDEAGALRQMASAVGIDDGWADPALMGEW
jgi:shikimate dehydrogenase